MSHPMRLPREDDLLSPRETEDVLERLARSSDVLDLLRRADEVTPPEIDLWSALTLGTAGSRGACLYVHSPAPITPALALALAESMHNELAACCRGAPAPSEVRHAALSCADLGAEVMTRLCDAFHDHLTQLGSEPVGITRAGASATDGLTLQRWREADRALEVAAWMLGALVNETVPSDGVIDPISGRHSRAFFEQLLRNELARHQRMPAELSVVLLQLRRSSPMMADEPPSPALLAATGMIMSRELREADVVARLDSRRMGALLPCTSPRNGLIAAGRLGEALQDAEELEGWSIDIGVSGMGMEVVGAAELLEQATDAMLSAGRGASRFPFVYV